MDNNMTERELVLTELLAIEHNLTENLKGALAQSNASLKVVQAQAQQLKDAYDGQSAELLKVTEELKAAKANWQKCYDDLQEKQPDFSGIREGVIRHLSDIDEDR